jgi:hypothetical protein
MENVSDQGNRRWGRKALWAPGSKVFEVTYAFTFIAAR